MSRVLNNPQLVNETKRRAVLKSVDVLGFQPNLLARGLASGQSMTIGIVTQNIGTSFYDDIIRAIIAKLRTTDYAPIFGDGLYDNATQASTINTLCDRQVDGVILLGGNASADDLAKAAERRPVVLVARDLVDWDGVKLDCDNFDLGYIATEHLIQHGHRRIAHVTGNRTHQDAVRRTEGYIRALNQYGIELDSQLMFEGDFYGESGIAAIEHWLEQGIDFTAVFAANDLTAFGVNLALTRRGLRIPEEVSLIGIDDKIESPLISPPLTSVRQPSHGMGTAAAAAITSLCGGGTPESQTFYGEVIPRESVANRD